MNGLLLFAGAGPVAAGAFGAGAGGLAALVGVGHLALWVASAARRRWVPLALDAGEVAVLACSWRPYPLCCRWGMYFIFWHSLQHVLRLTPLLVLLVLDAGRPAGRELLRRLAFFTRRAAPLLLVSCAALLALGYALAAPLPDGAAWFSLALVVASVVTLPHALLVMLVLDAGQWPRQRAKPRRAAFRLPRIRPAAAPFKDAPRLTAASTILLRMTSSFAHSAISPPVVLCDVNETLLDMQPLKRAVIKAVGNPQAFRQWFGLLLQYALVDTVGGTYHDFGLIGDAALDMAAAMLEEKPLKPAQKREILALLTALPAHPDVPEGLTRLLDTGFRLAAFSQSSQRVLDAQLRHAGLIGYFERGISVADVRHFKPHPATYRYAAAQLGVVPAQATLLAAHGWDVAGAQRAGLAAGFVARPGQSLYPLAPPPTYQGPTLLAVARQLISRVR